MLTEFLRSAQSCVYLCVYFIGFSMRALCLPGWGKTLSVWMGVTECHLYRTWSPHALQENYIEVNEAMHNKIPSKSTLTILDRRIIIYMD